MRRGKEGTGERTGTRDGGRGEAPLCAHWKSISLKTYNIYRSSVPKKPSDLMLKRQKNTRII